MACETVKAMASLYSMKVIPLVVSAWRRLYENIVLS